MNKLFKYNCPPPKHKHKGSGLLIMAIVSAAIVGLTAVSLVKVNYLAFNGLDSSKTALQAQQYAASKAELIRSIKYDNLAAQNKTTIQNSSFQDEVKISAESVYPSDSSIKQKICTINVYKTGESLPRSSLIVTRLSAKPDSGVPKGSIIPWYGQIKDIPSGFVLCNGSNGTPDLRNRFLVGAGNTYGLGNIGGADSVKLSGTQIGSHYHRFGYHNGNNTGYFLTSAGSFVKAPLESWMRAGKWNGSGGGGYNGWDGGSGTNFASGQNLVTSLAVATAAQEPHENRPPYYALYYIMKL